MLKAEVDKDALPNVEEGFQINFCKGTPHHQPLLFMF